MVVVMLGLLFIYRSAVQEEPSNGLVDPGQDFSPATEDTILEKGAFRVLLPKGWIDFGEEGELFAVLMEEPEDQDDLDQMGDWAEARIIDFPAEEGETLADYVALIHEDLEMEIEYGQDVAIRDDRPTELKDREAHYLEVEFGFEGEETITGLLLVQDGERIWNIVTIAPLATWNDHQRTFDRIVQSFTIN